MPAHDYKPGHARKAIVRAIAAAIIALALAACASTTTTDSATVTPAAASPGASAVTITGSGSTFDAPFFDLAFARYHQENPAVTIRYSAVGSSAGIAAFSARQVDFGATDVPLTAAGQAAAQGGASVQVPVDLGRRWLRRGRLAESLLDEVALARRAVQMRSSEATARVTAFTGRLEAVRERGADAAAIVTGESRRLLAELNDAAEREAAQLATDLRARIGALLDGELATAASAEVERQGRERLVQLTIAAAELWRQAQRERLEEGLSRLDARLTGQLAAELDAVRDAAAELLGLDLALPSRGERLTPERGFFYTVAEHVDQAELLAGAVRRRLPGPLGRRLARDHVLGQVRDLAGSQIGRARADLQYRLAETTRQLIQAVGRGYSASTDRLASALEMAATLRGQRTGQAESRLSELDRREWALRGVLARLDTVRAEHHRADCHGQLPGHPPHRPTGASDRGHPRLHHGLHRRRRDSGPGSDPHHRPATLPAPARRTQDRHRRTHPGPRAAARAAGDSRRPLRLLAGDKSRLRRSGRGGPRIPPGEVVTSP